MPCLKNIFSLLLPAMAAYFIIYLQKTLYEKVTPPAKTV